MRSLTHPRRFVTERRLDIAVKYRFFRFLRNGGDPEAEALYRWHIEQRTGGREPRSTKATIEDYIAAARGLLASMQARGFDREYPVRIGSNGALMDGAHRIACALLLEVDVAVEEDARPGKAAPWDYRWFRQRGLGDAACMQIERLRVLLHEGRGYLCTAGIATSIGMGQGLQTGP